MPYFMEENQLGQYWDGKQYISNPNNQKQLTFLYHRLMTKGKEFEEANCHFDGVFKCSRCWRMHNIVDNYDLLCDGCVRITLEQDNLFLIDKINKWKDMARRFWSAEFVPEIAIRIFARNILNSRKEDEYRESRLRIRGE